MSDAVPVSIPASLVQATQVPTAASGQAESGNKPPHSGIGANEAAASTPSPSALTSAGNRIPNSVPQKPALTNQASVPALVQQLNKYLNDSGRANQFRIDPTSRDQTIQEINPANGEVIAEFSVAEFPALARGLGVSGMLVDSHA